MRLGRSALGEQLSRLPVTETLLRTRLNVPDLAGNLSDIEAICVANIERKARDRGAVVRADDGWILTAGATNGRIATIDEVLYFRLDEHFTAPAFERDVRVELTLDKAGCLDLAVSLTQLRSAPRPSLHTPSILRDVIEKYRVFDDVTQVSAGVERFATSEQFSDAIFDLERNLPLLVISQPLILTPEEISGLARRVSGAARVIILEDVEVSWGVTRRYGQLWSAFNGAIRVYAAGLIPDDEWRSRSGRLFFGPGLHQALEVDRNAALDGIVEATLAPSTFRFADEPVPSLDAALAERRKARRRGTMDEAVSLLALPLEQPGEEVSEDASAPDAAASAEATTKSGADEIADLEAELVRLRAENESLERTNNVLRNERDQFEQLGIEAEAKAKELQSALDSLKLADPSTPFSGLSDAWAGWIGEVVNLARHASQDALQLVELREEAATSRAKAEALELALSQKTAAGAPQSQAERPRLGDLTAFESYLAQNYPGVFVLSPSAKRSFKNVIYDDPARFYSVIDLLGTAYVAEQRAGGQLTEFSRRAEQLRLKSTPSCTAGTFNGDLGQYHRVPLSDGSLAQMFELRDRGTTFERRHFLYIGLAYDPGAQKVVLNTFEHPPTPSDRT